MSAAALITDWSSDLMKSTVLASRALSSSKVFSFIGIFWRFRSGEPSRRAFGKIRGKLYLSSERKHVWEQPRPEQHRRIDLFRPCMSGPT